ncbi:hypothetical protein GF327_02995 [Candidatus Woesearchaeota archaeon]|nr:hypothetical protein [Candidatus Woesearchaeota archaeon]
MKPKITPSLVLIVILAVTVISLLAYIFVSTRPVCGNGIIENKETQQTCCLDAGCPGDAQCRDNSCVDPECKGCQFLKNHKCVSYECCNDNDCKNNQICADNKCQDFTCGECKHPLNHKCVKSECCSDEDCDDNDVSTFDICENNRCINEKETVCRVDGLCPDSCSNKNDPDCDDHYYTYTNYDQGISFRYPDAWTIDDYKDRILINKKPYEIYISFIKTEEEDPESAIRDELINQGVYIKRVSKDSLEFNGYPADLLVYEYNQSIPQMNWYSSLLVEHYIIEREKSTHVIETYSEKEQYQKFNQEIQKILDSFKFVKSEKRMTPFLWKIEDSYLFGTVHLDDERLKILPECLSEIINKSRTTYTEIVYTESFSDDFIDHYKYEGNQTLKERMPDELYKRVRHYLENYGFEIDFFEDVTLDGIAGVLYSLNSFRGDNIILDKYISDSAIAAHNSIAALEDIFEHDAVLSERTQEDKLNSLRSALDWLEKVSISHVPDELLADYYMSGSKEVMNNKFNPEMKISEKFYSALVTERNDEMADKIFEIENSDNDTYLFAVGVSHFIGEDNIIDRLEHNGMNVRRVSCKT